MKQRITDIIKVVLMLGLSILVITLIFIYKSTANIPDKSLILQDTISVYNLSDKIVKDSIPSID